MDVRRACVAMLVVWMGGFSGLSVARGGSGGDDAAWAERGSKFGGVEWVTRPSRDSALGFTQSQEVHRLLVRSGDRVKAGQILARARDGELLASIDVQRARAGNMTEVENAKAQLELAQSRFDAADRAMKSDALNIAEFDERRIALTTAKIGLEAASKRAEEERLRLVQLEKQVERYRVEAPFDGVVDTVAADEGQTATENQPIIRIVNIDTLWVDVPIPTAQTIIDGLRPDHPAWVLLDLPGEAVVLTGRVLFVSPVADAASQTRRVRVEARNPSLLPAGTRARVRFSAPASTWELAGAGGTGGTGKVEADGR